MPIGNRESVVISLWVLKVPIPCAADDIRDLLELRSPAQYLARFLGGGDQTRRISGAARLIYDRDIFSGHFSAGLNDFQDRDAASDPEVKEIAIFNFESQGMRLCQIGHMDVVANTASVRGGIIGPKD